jgi:signal transduction histidine kinase
MEKAAAQRLRLAFQEIAGGNFSHRIEYASSSAFLTNLVDEFNKMSARLGQAEEHREEVEKQLHQAQRMEAVGRLAGGVAHDYNNMTSVIIGNVELALEDLDRSDLVREYLEEIHNAAKRSAEITHQLLAYARCQPIVPKVLDLNQVVASMLKMLERLIGEDIELTWYPGTSLWLVKIDPSQVNQILANLCVNARDAISDVGRILIETANREFDEAYCSLHQGFLPGEYVQLVVSDNGMGMDTETKENIFEPFFSTKQVGQGTGLGLSTIYGIVKQNDGFINVYSEPGEGATFKVYLPRAMEVSVEAVVGKKTEMIHGKGETLLVVEDELAILKIVEKMLKQLGYTV